MFVEWFQEVKDLKRKKEDVEQDQKLFKQHNAWRAFFFDVYEIFS